MKKVISSILIIALCLSMCTLGFADCEMDSASETTMQQEWETSSLGIEEIIQYSTDLKRSNGRISGVFTSKVFDTNVSGYTYQIKCNWEAYENYKGEYTFDAAAIDTEVETIENKYLLESQYYTYSYKLDHATGVVGGAGVYESTLRFYIHYEFEIQDTVWPAETVVFDKTHDYGLSELY